MGGSDGGQVVDAFRKCFSASGQGGTITRPVFGLLLKELSGAAFSDAEIDRLIDSYGRFCGTEGISANEMKYEDLLGWLMDEDMDSVVAAIDEACQAALDGALGELRNIVAAAGEEVLTKPGFVMTGEAMAGLTLLGETQEICLLQPLVENQSIRGATVLQYAAFAGRTEILRYLLTERGVDTGSVGGPLAPSCIASCHRLWATGEYVDDEEGALDLLQAEAPARDPDLDPAALKVLKRKAREAKQAAAARKDPTSHRKGPGKKDPASRPKSLPLAEDRTPAGRSESSLPRLSPQISVRSETQSFAVPVDLSPPVVGLGGGPSFVNEPRPPSFEDYVMGASQSLPLEASRTELRKSRLAVPELPATALQPPEKIREALDTDGSWSPRRLKAQESARKRRLVEAAEEAEAAELPEGEQEEVQKKQTEEFINTVKLEDSFQDHMENRGFEMLAWIGELKKTDGD